MSETPHHPAVQHPVRLRRSLHREGMGRAGKANDWLATHLAVVFGLVWTVWALFLAPLIVQAFSPHVQAKFFFYSSGWIQLFALPLLVYVGNKVQRSSDAQSEVLHVALTHIATIEDQNGDLLRQNTDLTKLVHEEQAALADAVRAAVGSVREAHDLLTATAAAVVTVTGPAPSRKAADEKLAQPPAGMTPRRRKGSG